MSYRGWWSDKAFSALGEAYFDCAWAQQALIERSLIDGGSVYDYSIEGVAKTTIIELVKKFDVLGADFRLLFEAPPGRGDPATRIFLVNEKSCVGLWTNEGDLEGRIVSADKELFTAAKALLEEAIGPKASAGRVYVMMSTDSGIKLQSIGIASVPLERANYNPSILDDYDTIVADFKSKAPKGRLAIFDGETGTGKTFMVRGLLDALPDALFVVIPSSLVESLSGPGMIGSLLEIRRNKGEHPTIFIIEDADRCLMRRDDSNVTAVSELLNLGDGILGALMDIRLVCTTNLKDEELDDAVVRPGRLTRKVHIGPLEPGIAQALYEKLVGKPGGKLSKKMSLAEVYSAARDAGWKPVRTQKTLGFGSDLSPSAVAVCKEQGMDLELTPEAMALVEDE